MQTVKWGEYILGDLFDIDNTLSFNADRLISGNDYDYVTRTSLNQGVFRTTGFVNEENINPSGTWSLGLLQMDFFYRKKPWYAGQFVRKITPKIKIKKSAVLFFSTLLNKQKPKLLSVLVRDVDSVFRSTKIQLPTKNGNIDFDFIESFIKELQVERIAQLETERTTELNTCLKIAGLDDCELSLEEKEALEAKPNYMPFLLSSLFDSENGDVDIKKKDINNEGDIVITAGVANNGISGKTDIKAKVFPKNTLTIDMFGNCFYRDFKYKMVTHARVFALLPKQPISNKEVGLYYQTLLTKYSEIYSFSSMCSWGKIKDCFISLPVTDNNEIDFEYIKNYIRAIEKTAIQKLYNDKGAFIEKAKEIIAS